VNGQRYPLKPPLLLMLTLLYTSVGLVSCLQKTTPVQPTLPILEFPQQGLDDSDAYQGYTTRFVRDSDGNTVQLSIDRRSGRVVNIWADAANESIAFTVRDTAGRPATLQWDSPGVELSARAPWRYLRYTLSIEAGGAGIGLYLLGSMRQERDYQYHKGNLRPFTSGLHVEQELRTLLQNLKRLPPPKQDRLITLLNAQNTQELATRLLPQVTYHQSESSEHVLVEQTTFDGRNHLSLELSVDGQQATVALTNGIMSIRPGGSGPLRLTVLIGTDSPSLTPLRSDEIFNRDFRRFYDRAEAEADNLAAESSLDAASLAGQERWLRFQWLRRQVRGVELLASQEKIMAGLPNFATYFGRDMLLSALMLEPIWSPAMLEHVIASALRKLSPSGRVSHEEALGNQAIREHAAEFNHLAGQFILLRDRGDEPGADSVFASAAKILTNMQAVREAYSMVDEDFQLPVVAARYLTRLDIPARQKRRFLLSKSGNGAPASRLSLLMRNLGHISSLTRRYVEQPVTENLIAFPRIDERRWFPGSWRDSGAGYANGRYPMDVNVIWAPKALESVGQILATLRELGWSNDELESVAPEIVGTAIQVYALDPEALQAALSVWRGTAKHFSVSFSSQEVERRVGERISRFTAAERTYWTEVLTHSDAHPQGVTFLALSLDAEGVPIPVANTDPAALWFLEDFTADILEGRRDPAELLAGLDMFVRPYPAGLFVEGLGPLVANDAYAPETVWDNFRRDPYHSPRVVWGREVNLLQLGLARQISSALDSEGRVKDPRLDPYVRELRSVLAKTLTAVEASGLRHNELWSYRIVDDDLAPIRYPTSSDIQLWNLTDLAVRYALARIPNL